MKKTLGRLCYEKRWGDEATWCTLTPGQKESWERAGRAVERAVLRRLKEGKKK